MSCTSEVAYSNCTIDGRRVILIDTPGFDDTTISDTDILKMIALYLSTMCVVLRVSDFPHGLTR